MKVSARQTVPYYAETGRKISLYLFPKIGQLQFMVQKNELQSGPIYDSVPFSSSFQEKENKASARNATANFYSCHLTLWYYASVLPVLEYGSHRSLSRKQNIKSEMAEKTLPVQLSLTLPASDL